MDKLVRDLIPEIIERQGNTPVISIASDGEYKTRLIAKLREELEEFEMEETIEEMADMMEVLRAICQWKGFNLDEVEAVREKKTQERGGFQKKIILEKIIKNGENSS